MSRVFILSLLFLLHSQSTYASWVDLSVPFDVTIHFILIGIVFLFSYFLEVNDAKYSDVSMFLLNLLVSINTILPTSFIFHRLYLNESHIDTLRFFYLCWIFLSSFLILQWIKYGIKRKITVNLCIFVWLLILKILY
jgi:hypothetical protein